MNCQYCGQRFFEKDRCCTFCGAPIILELDPGSDLESITSMTFGSFVRMIESSVEPEFFTNKKEECTHLQQIKC